MVQLYGYRFLGGFYTGSLPVFLLAALCWRSPAYLLLAAVHLALFRTDIGHFLRHEARWVPAAGMRMLRHGR